MFDSADMRDVEYRKPLSRQRASSDMPCGFSSPHYLLQAVCYPIKRDRFSCLARYAYNAFIRRFFVNEAVQRALYCDYKPFVVTLQTFCSATTTRLQSPYNSFVATLQKGLQRIKTEIGLSLTHAFASSNVLRHHPLVCFQPDNYPSVAFYF